MSDCFAFYFEMTFDHLFVCQHMFGHSHLIRNVKYSATWFQRVKDLFYNLGMTTNLTPIVVSGTFVNTNRWSLCRLEDGGAL